MSASGPKIILTDRASVSADMRRVTAARRRLRELDEARPSGAAPLTAEDLAIFQRFAQKDAAKFGSYIRHAYQDYCYFYISRVTIEREAILASLT